MTNNNNVLMEDSQTLKLEKMRYNNNSLSYKIGLVGIAFSLLAMFFALNSVNPNSVGTVVAILINILVFLFGFLCCEKVKVYQKKYAYGMIGISVVCFARIFWYPIVLFKAYNKFMDVLGDGKTSTKFEEAVKASPNLGASIQGKFIETDYDKINDVYFGYRKATGYLTANGNVRGVFIIIFLAIASAAFLTSAIITIKKSTALEKHLANVNNK